MIGVYLNCGPGVSRRDYCGLTLKEWEVNGYSDSDFYALVWDLDTQTPKQILWNTTRAGGGGSCVVDAKPEIVQAYKNYCARKDAELVESIRAECLGKPHKGAVVEVFKNTRGKKAGFTGKSGVVKYVGEKQVFGFDYSKKYSNAGMAFVKASFGAVFNQFGVPFGGVYEVGVKFEGEDELIYFDSDRLKVLKPSGAF